MAGKCKCKCPKASRPSPQKRQEQEAKKLAKELQKIGKFTSSTQPKEITFWSKGLEQQLVDLINKRAEERMKKMDEEKEYDKKLREMERKDAELESDERYGQ